MRQSKLLLDYIQEKENARSFAAVKRFPGPGLYCRCCFLFGQYFYTWGWEMNNYAKAVEIYEKGGQYAVYDAVEKGELIADGWHLCVPCETTTPHEDGVCLVCGTPIRKE